MAYKHSSGERRFDDIIAENDSDSDTKIDFNEDYISLMTNGANRIKISGSSGLITFNEAFTFPAADGSANQILKTNGSGQLTWTNQSSGGGGDSSGVTVPSPRLYFSGISAASQIGNNSFTNATITTDNGKYENGFIDFGSSGNTAPARFESEIPLLGGVYTFSFWFYSKRTGSDWGSILRRESTGSPVNTQDYPIVTEDSTDELGVYTESGGQFYSSGYDMTSLEGTTSWTHMAVVANGTNSKFYINGSLVGTANAVVTTSVKELGAYDGNDTQTFAEGIDDFAHWAETLSDEQISEIYNSTSKLRDITQGTGGGGNSLSTTAPKTGNYTASNWEFVLVNLAGASGDVTITLPNASANAQIAVKISSQAMGKIVTVDGNASQTIDGTTTKTMETDYESIHLISDGSAWWRIS